jgi:hypothetical protein
MNPVFSSDYKASKYLNEVAINDSKDYKKAASIYTKYNELRRFAVLEYLRILVYKDFVQRINVSKWENDLTRTHLLNLIHAIHNNSIR